MLNHTRLFSLVLMLSLVAAFAISGIVTTPLQATSGVSMPGPMITLYATDHDEFTRVVPPQQRVVAPSATTITVNYMGSWDPQAKTAFQYAVDLWESYIATPVPISVDASWEALGTNMLGRAGPTTVRFNFTNAPRLNTWYPIALANALRGLDLAPSESDITANFSSSFSNWYLGTDGNTPAGKYDFVSVVLHELGHGLGFVGSGDVSNGQGQWGLSNGVVNYPMIYDVYTENGAETDTISTAAFPNPSAALAAHLQSNDLYWSGAKAVAANGGTRPRLYAPSSWKGGASFLHLDESTYDSGSPNSLMTPTLGSAEAIHSPGPITLGIFRDMGWPLAATPPTATGVPSGCIVNEVFDKTLPELQAAGWTTQNRSEPGNPSTWDRGEADVFTAHSGAATSYVAANFNSTNDVGTISDWLMTPVVSLANGSTFSFWSRTADPQDQPEFPDRLEVRLSKAGQSTNVGATASAVGDFSTLLLTINPNLQTGVYPKVWTQYTVTVSGLAVPTTGRFALRYFVTSGGENGTNSSYIGIDDVRYCAGATVTPTTITLPSATATKAPPTSTLPTSTLPTSTLPTSTLPTVPVNLTERLYIPLVIR